MKKLDHQQGRIGNKTQILTLTLTSLRAALAVLRLAATPARPAGTARRTSRCTPLRTQGLAVIVQHTFDVLMENACRQHLIGDAFRQGALL